MNTAELPPPNLEQKMDMLIQLVNEFRSSLLERMDKLEADSRERYVDLRQRSDKQEERLSRMEERQLKMEDRQLKMEERQLKMEETLGDMKLDVAFLVKNFYTIDRKLDVFVNEFSLWKDRVRELEDTQKLRH